MRKRIVFLPASEFTIKRSFSLPLPSNFFGISSCHLFLFQTWHRARDQWEVCPILPIPLERRPIREEKREPKYGQTHQPASTHYIFLQAIYFIKAQDAQGNLKKGDNFIFPTPWKLKFFPKNNLLCSSNRLRRGEKGSRSEKKMRGRKGWREGGWEGKQMHETGEERNIKRERTTRTQSRSNRTDSWFHEISTSSKFPSFFKMLIGTILPAHLSYLECFLGFPSLSPHPRPQKRLNGSHSLVHNCGSSWKDTK